MEKKKEEKKRRISSFNGYLSHSSSRVEFELKLGLRLTNKRTGKLHLIERHKHTDIIMIWSYCPAVGRRPETNGAEIAAAQTGSLHIPHVVPEVDLRLMIYLLIPDDQPHIVGLYFSPLHHSGLVNPN